LCLNFIQILKLEKKTILEDIMGITDFIPVLGTRFLIVFPASLLVLTVFNLFDVFPKAYNLFGFGYINFRINYDDDKISEGKLFLNKSKHIILITELFIFKLKLISG